MNFPLAVFFGIGAALLAPVLALAAYAGYCMAMEYRRDRVPALLYHRLLPKQKVDAGEIVSNERTYVCYDTAFEEQMALLHKEGYETICLDDFLKYRLDHSMMPAKPILITFDDGFESNYRYAFPVLKKYCMKATIFVTPDRESQNFRKNAPLDSPLTRTQIQEMSQHGIAIESHGMTHRYLTELEPEVASWELKESKRTLENLVEKPVRFLAIPSGAYNDTVRRLAKESGYEAVFCMLKGSNHCGSDLFALRRVVIGRDFTLKDFQRAIGPAAAWQLRLTSYFQNLLLNSLGPKRCDALRNWLFQTRLAPVLVLGQLRYFAVFLAALALIAFVSGISLLVYR